MTEPDDPLIGREIGRFRIAQLLAEGGMGRVYLGIQPTIGSRVAIKVLAEGNDATLLERFFAEAKAVNLIRHENIVSVLDMAKLEGGRPYIVMEYIEGHTLAALVRSNPAPLGGVVQVMTEVLSALSAAHAIGIVHRDLKPDNILVTGEGHAKVLDFGIAKLMPGISQQLSPRTRTGALLGTPAYMAPEQISGSGQIDPRTDIYAAGIVLYEAVTGRVPFVAETLFDLMRMHLEVAPQSPRALRPQLPVSFEQVIMQALAKDPAHRFQSAGAMSQALQHASKELHPDEWKTLSTRGAIITGRGRAQPTHASPTPAEVAAPTKSMRWAVIALIAAVLSVGAIVTTVIVFKRQPAVATAPADAAPVTIEAPIVEAPPPLPPAAPPVDPVPVKKQPITKDTGVTIVATPASGEVTVPADYNAKSFDPVKYLPKALALARRLAPDAKLTRFDFDPVFSDGRVDLTMEGRDRQYDFRSEARSARPKDRPPNMPFERPCRIQVELTPTTVTARILTSEDCDDKLVRHPTCNFASVWKQALAEGTPKDYVARIAWLFDEKWFFDTDLADKGGGVSTFEDKCP